MAASVKRISANQTAPNSGSGHETQSKIAVAVVIAVIALISSVMLFFVIMCFTAKFSKRRAQQSAKLHSLKRLKRLDEAAPAQLFGDWRLSCESKELKFLSHQIICPICLDLFRSDQDIREIPCQHIFHRRCLNRWYLNTQHRCPLCKAEFLLKDSVEGIQEDLSSIHPAALV